MEHKDTFSAFHPIINFLYFALVIGFTMFFMHPVCLSISLLGGLAYAIYLSGQKAVRFALWYMLPLMIFAAVVNPAFNHAGVTILAYLPSGNPLTLESILYGLDAAVMLIAVLFWFRCYTQVMTSDKFVYLFGRIVPALSLILSMTLRFVPKFTAQFQVVKEARFSVERNGEKEGLLRRLRQMVQMVSIMITWSLENAIETADSMKSRGYGLKGRTAFSIYKWTPRDRAALVWLLFCGFYVFSGAVAGALEFQYFPAIYRAEVTPMSISFFIVYGALCLTPVVINGREDWIWKCLKSEI